FFSVMGVPPVFGRSFSAEEGERGDQVAVLSYGFWQRQFASSADALCNTLEVDGITTKIIGVMPVSFQFPSKDCQLWLLNTADPRWPAFARVRLADAFCAVGRLKPNVSLEQAQAEMDRIAKHLEKQYPETDAGLGIKVVPLRLQLAGNTVRLALWI